MYKEQSNRIFMASDVSFLFAGTLIILITSLFMNAGTVLEISMDDKGPNLIVMNTVISAASSGLLIAIVNQVKNMVTDKDVV